MADEPSPSELRRLYETLREDTRRGFSDVNSRLDKMPTSDLLMAHLQGWQQQINTARDEIATLRVHVDMQHNELKAEVKAEENAREAQHKADVDGRRWVIGAVSIPIICSLLAIAIATGVIG